VASTFQNNSLGWNLKVSRQAFVAIPDCRGNPATAPSGQ